MYVDPSGFLFADFQDGRLFMNEVMGYKHNAKLQELVDFIAPQEKVIIDEETKLFFGLKEKILAPHKELIKYLIENLTNNEAKARLEKYDKLFMWG